MALTDLRQQKSIQSNVNLGRGGLYVGMSVCLSRFVTEVTHLRISAKWNLIIMRLKVCQKGRVNTLALTGLW